jgi:hypothetical protein
MPARASVVEELTVVPSVVRGNLAIFVSVTRFSEFKIVLFEFDLNQIDLNQMIKNRFKISVHFEMII